MGIIPEPGSKAALNANCKSPFQWGINSFCEKHIWIWEKNSIPILPFPPPPPSPCALPGSNKCQAFQEDLFFRFIFIFFLNSYSSSPSLPSYPPTLPGPGSLSARHLLVRGNKILYVGKGRQQRCFAPSSAVWLSWESVLHYLRSTVLENPGRWFSASQLCKKPGSAQLTDIAGMRLGQSRVGPFWGCASASPDQSRAEGYPLCPLDYSSVPKVLF